jgi:hypothetical protein
MKKWNAPEITTLSIEETANGLFSWGYEGLLSHRKSHIHPGTPTTPIVEPETPVTPVDPTSPTPVTPNEPVDKLS